MISKYSNKANTTAENFIFTNKTNTPKQLPNHKETSTRQNILIKTSLFENVLPV